MAELFNSLLIVLLYMFFLLRVCCFRSLVLLIVTIHIIKYSEMRHQRHKIFMI